MEFTGERFLPDLNFPEISYEHWHRYLYAAQFVKGKNVLDIACGEGYGSSLLAQSAGHVIGIDIDPKTITYASSKYIQSNLEFKVGSLDNIPLGDDTSLDGIISFESIEHISEEQQEAFMREAKRILKPDGILLVSTPNKFAYSDVPGYRNEFHVKEFYVREFRAFLEKHFKHVKLLGQEVYPVSYLWDLEEKASQLTEFKIELSSKGFRPSPDAKVPLYVVAVCSDKEQNDIFQSLQVDLSKQMIAARDQHIAYLESDRDQRIAQLESSRDQQIAHLESEISEREQSLQRLAAQADEKLAALSEQLKEREKTLNTARAALHEIHSSRGWKLVQLLWRIRVSIAPPGSRRARTLSRFARATASPIRRTAGSSLDAIMPGLPKLEIEKGYAGFDPSKDTVLIASHEASRTGAPMLSLNLARSLGRKYNVVSVLLAGGGLVKHIREQSSILAGPIPSRYDPVMADALIDQITRSYRIKFAIVNSIEARAVIAPLARRFVPVIHLVHEFASYTRPNYAFLEAALWSEEMIFSAQVTYENAILEHPQLAGSSLHILPQGNCDVPVEDGNPAALVQEEARVIRKLRPEGSPDDMVVILGAGTVQMRKGVDLFIDCAAKILRSSPDRNFRFVWIGDGYDPIEDITYSVYLADQIRRAGLQDCIFFMKNTSAIEAAYKTADILVLSSRLDPLPNVAIDIMLHGKPVICFEKTTGIADILIKQGFADQCVAPYLDTDDMASKIQAFIDSKSLRQDLGGQLRQMAIEVFDMDHYTAQLEEFGLASIKRIAQERLDASEIAQSGLACMEYHLSQHLLKMLKTPDDVYRYYVRSWGSGIGRRKLFPGFHPGIFFEKNGMNIETGDPLAEYLRAGQPDGPWRYEILSSEETKPSLPSGTRIALHIHAYYPDLLSDMLARVMMNHVRPDLFVSAPSNLACTEVEKILKDYPGKVMEIQAVPNRGRDIAPFLTAFGNRFVDQYDLIGHLHTKKTESLQDSQIGEDWRIFLLENLLGGKSRMADAILSHMSADPSIGMIFPDDPNIIGWSKNRPYADELGRQLGLDALPENFLFPIGTMFWARVKALAPLFERKLDWQDYPTEPLPYDGTILHAIERLLPLVAAKQGFRLVLTNVKGITR
jgi:glycosyltransferase involved in cell wall biosynthesis/ubiquinone/menaquinone biosynthesis C-methylase UbiE